jgi:hypothetical protein
VPVSAMAPARYKEFSRAKEQGALFGTAGKSSVELRMLAVFVGAFGETPIGSSDPASSAALHLGQC